jgi:hypothetical protein
MMRFPRLNPERLSKPSDDLSRAASACLALQRRFENDLELDRRMGAGCGALLGQAGERDLERTARRFGFAGAEELGAALEQRLGGRAAYYVAFELVHL